MVVNNPIERVGNGQVDYLLNRLANIERQLNEGTARSSFPFSVGHLGVTDFQIIPSLSGDGSADIYLGNGAGGKLLQVTTDTSYGSKILILRDQAGRTMLSTDAKAGYGLGVPSYPFTWGGYPWNLTLSGNTTKGTAREFARGGNFVYNPACYINPLVRMSSTTSETVQIFCEFKDSQGNITQTADRTIALTANVISLSNIGLDFAKLWDADDMNGICYVFIKAYCTTANPANVNIQACYTGGWGISQGFYDQNSNTWAV